MSAGGARRGRRDNGLDAADYAVAGDVDPRVGEHLLDVLAAGGIAAYLQPSADLNPILRATTFPARPTDRLYVDRTHLDTAREHLDKLTGGADPTPPAPRPSTRTGGDQSDVDAEWAKIVAGFHTAVDPTAPPWPAAEGVDPTRAPDPPKSDGPERPPRQPGGTLPSATDISGVSLNRRRTDEPSLLDGLDTFGTGTDDDSDDERYTPPPPPPLPHISKYAVAGVLGVVLGFVLFLFPWLLPIDRNYVTLIGFTAIVGGAVTLVWRLRSGDDDDDFDDGAVV
ncbi:DUF308 domain-containing protein [Amorphoplanes digitatis]|uniref:DUF308 domain-containing protein n=1 Tax=Actinoplanes digitatis TaxID=1868 RepID=A0A7W7I324_9ACTN|nr:DUF308 domain-containing protein [Actinoplanes digitatis]MBB4765534.1 hypothetical protein [Actinoplanes digitatis]GID93574.1 hypothetical protein Adi01nite_29860 [Actinoplanes digitatis]